MLGPNKDGTDGVNWTSFVCAGYTMNLQELVIDYRGGTNVFLNALRLVELLNAIMASLTQIKSLVFIKGCGLPRSILQPTDNYNAALENLKLAVQEEDEDEDEENFGLEEDNKQEENNVQQEDNAQEENTAQGMTQSLNPQTQPTP